MIVRHADGTAHFSNLKKFNRSPAHYKASCEDKFEPTRAMRIGTGTHAMVLGPRAGQKIIRYEGERRGNAWKDFVASHQDAEILTSAEWLEAEAIAASVKADPVAAEFFRGAYEKELSWDEDGILCRTAGVDVCGDGFLVELKVSETAEPQRFQRRASDLFYHAQLAFYARGAKAHKIDVSKGLFIVAVEASAPHPVTVHKLSDAMVEIGDKLCSLWLEKLRMCEENNFWPGYVQSVVDFDPMPWMIGGGDDDEEAAA